MRAVPAAARKLRVGQPPRSRGAPARYTFAGCLGYGAQMSADPILYSFRRCPYAMRARMALLATGLSYEHREVLLRAKPAAMLAASPKGTVPVLVLPDGSVIEESLDIMRWALAQYDPADWLARHDAALVAHYDDAFKHHLDRYKYAGRYEGDPVAYRAAGLAMLASLSLRLVECSYLGGAAPGFDDIAIFPFVRQFAAVDPAWFAGNAPNAVQGWLASLVGSELFERAMVRLVPWS